MKIITAKMKTKKIVLNKNVSHAFIRWDEFIHPQEAKDYLDYPISTYCEVMFFTRGSAVPNATDLSALRWEPNCFLEYNFWKPDPTGRQAGNGIGILVRPNPTKPWREFKMTFGRP